MNFTGNEQQHAIIRREIGGRHITDYLQTILERERGYSFISYTERECLRDLKENLGYVALDYEKEMERERAETENKYELPDGTVITVGDEMFRCTEVLFKPSLIGKETDGLHVDLYKSTMKCGTVEIQREIYRRGITLSGGSTMFKGLADRLQKEVTVLAPSAMKIKVRAHPERKYSVWIGGSILASLSTFQSMWTTKEAYDEEGPRIAHKQNSKIPEF